MPATLLEFARVNDAVAATPKKLEKSSLLANYVRTLDDADLRLALRYSTGLAFAATTGRTLNTGSAIVWDVTLDLLDLDPRQFHALVVRSGEIGEAIAQVWDSSRRAPRMETHEGAAEGLFAPRDRTGDCHVAATGGLDLTLAEVAGSFDALAQTGVVRRKRELLKGLLSRCHDGREAAYVTKVLFGELRTGAREGVIAAAIAEAFGQTLGDVLRCQLLVGDFEEVALLARRGALASARFRLFHPIQFMLANPVETAEQAAAAIAGRSFVAEDKLDGIRAQVHKSGERLAIYTRTMDRADESFPDVVSAIVKLPGEFLLDGEIVPYREGVVLPFAHIQKRLGRKRVSDAMLLENPALFIAFDLLYADGELLLDHPLSERRGKLQALAAGGGLALSAPAPVKTAEEISAIFAAARTRRNEGIVLKDFGSAYASGRRGGAWIKLKTHLPTLDCVVTAAEHGHGKRRAVLSDYTFAVWDDLNDPGASTLVNVGKAYSGLTDEEIARMTQTFLSLCTEKSGRVYRVRPEVVLEIAFDQIQKSARHASGYALRFPRIARIRWDKAADQADRLSRVAEIHRSAHNFAHAPAVSRVAAPPAAATLFDP